MDNPVRDEDKRLFEEFEKIFHESGKTHSKKLHPVLEKFCSLDTHISIEELVEKVRNENIFVTHKEVEDVMTLLCNYGIARELHLESGPKRYEHNHLKRHHDHFVCVHCGKITESIDKDLELALHKSAKKNKFLPFHHSLEFYGLCDKCLDTHKTSYPLSFAQTGEIGIVVDIHGGKALKNRLSNLGLTIGNEVEVIYNSSNVIVAVKETRIALGFGMAQKIMIEAHSCKLEENKM